MKNIKKLAIGGIIMSAVLFGNTQAFAAPTTVSQTTKLTAIIAKGDAAVTLRIKSLNDLSARITKMKYLSADQKTANTTTIDSATSAINAAKVKLDADTDLAQAKLDYMAIFNDNRIYGVVMPQIFAATYANNTLKAVASINADLTKIQARITKAQAASKDVTAVQAKYSDAQAKLTDANTQATNAITLAGTLAVDHGDKTIIASNKTINLNIKTAKTTLMTDMKAVHTDIISMRSSLKVLGF
jgi:hypothetical protein